MDTFRVRIIKGDRKVYTVRVNPVNGFKPTCDSYVFKTGKVVQEGDHAGEAVRDVPRCEDRRGLVDQGALASWGLLPQMRVHERPGGRQTRHHAIPLPRLPELLLGQERHLHGVVQAGLPPLGDCRLLDELQLQGDSGAGAATRNKGEPAYPT